jgi:hypothetical protein
MNAELKCKTELLIDEIEHELKEYKINFKGLSWRDKVLLLVKLHSAFKKIGVHANPEAADISSRERLKLYFLANAGQVISARELEIVAGISEYARRIRELRVQDGFKIITGSSCTEDFDFKIKPTEYILIDTSPDRKAANRWHVANRIRKEKKGGSQERILNYLKHFVGEVVTSEELYYVAKAKEFGRRIRELRTEHGYAIATCLTGRPDLKMGEYLLESAERVANPHDRRIPIEIQQKIYERDGNSCRLCGWNIQRWNSRDPRILELHHICQHVDGGDNSLENITLLCSKCHDKVHAKQIELPLNILD